MPVTFILGERDLMTPVKAGKTLAAAIPNAHTIVLPGAGHMMMAEQPEYFKHLEGTLESPEYTGKVLWALYNDPDMMAKSGRVLIGAEIGKDYGITDLGDAFPPSVRQLHHCEPPWG